VRGCWDASLKKYRRDSAAIEGKTMLHVIERRLEEVFGDTGALPTGKVGLTPSKPCCGRPGQQCEPDPADWKDPVWHALDIEPDHAARFRYSYQGDGKAATVAAVGDLDCDGHPVTFTLSSKIEAGKVVSRTVSDADPATPAATPTAPAAATPPAAATRAAALTPTAAATPTAASQALGPLRAGRQITEAALRGAFPAATITARTHDSEVHWLIKDAAAGLLASATPRFLVLDQGNLDLYGVKLGDDASKLAAPAFKRIACEVDDDRPGFVNCKLPWLTAVLSSCRPTGAAGSPAKLKGCTISELWWLPVQD